MTVIFIASDFYVGGYGLPVYEYVSQSCAIVLICYLLWRVETLSDLSVSQPILHEEEKTTSTENEESDALPLSISSNIGTLLKQYCEQPRLYLQYDISLSRLAMEIGTNRYYLSQYFSSQGLNYNAYINDLRVNHFISLYHEAIAAQRSFTVQQLAMESGYRSYNTFSDAFKRRTGQSVTAWMRTMSKKK